MSAEERFEAELGRFAEGGACPRCGEAGAAPAPAGLLPALLRVCWPRVAGPSLLAAQLLRA